MSIFTSAKKQLDYIPEDIDPIINEDVIESMLSLYESGQFSILMESDIQSVIDRIKVVIKKFFETLIVQVQKFIATVFVVFKKLAYKFKDKSKMTTKEKDAIIEANVTKSGKTVMIKELHTPREPLKVIIANVASTIKNRGISKLYMDIASDELRKIKDGLDTSASEQFIDNSNSEKETLYNSLDYISSNNRFINESEYLELTDEIDRRLELGLIGRTSYLKEYEFRNMKEYREKIDKFMENASGIDTVQHDVDSIVKHLRQMQNTFIAKLHNIGSSIPSDDEDIKSKLISMQTHLIDYTLYDIKLFQKYTSVVMRIYTTQIINCQNTLTMLETKYGKL